MFTKVKAIVQHFNYYTNHKSAWLITDKPRWQIMKRSYTELYHDWCYILGALLVTRCIWAWSWDHIHFIGAGGKNHGTLAVHRNMVELCGNCTPLNSSVSTIISFLTFDVPLLNANWPVMHEFNQSWLYIWTCVLGPHNCFSYLNFILSISWEMICCM